MLSSRILEIIFNSLARDNLSLHFYAFLTTSPFCPYWCICRSVVCVIAGSVMKSKDGGWGLVKLV